MGKFKLILQKAVFLFLIASVIAAPISYYLIMQKEKALAEKYKPISYLEALEKKALGGDANAMYRLGNNYAYGYNGLSVDLKEAVKWYRMAIEHGNAEAMNNLGLMYRDGEGVEKDLPKAIELLEKAVSLNNGNACSNLGYMYRKGIGVKPDNSKALALFSKGAEFGNVESSTHLALMYDEGLGVAQDFEKAFPLFLKAAKRGNPIAQFFIAQYYDTGKGSISKDRAQAKIWYEKAAAQNHDDAQRFLGFLYYDGEGGVSQDYLKAGEYFALSAKNGNEKAKEFIDYSVKKCSEKGHLTLIYYDMKSCYLAAFSGDALAMDAVASAYYDGSYNQSRDYFKAFEWYKKSAQAGYIGAQFRLAKLYQDGKGTVVNKIEAYAWSGVGVSQEKELNPGLIARAKDQMQKLYESMDIDEQHKAKEKLKEYSQKYIDNKKAAR